ncbi:MAG: TRAP transporter small permease subunit [Desulfohalobiaceae bacterium]|nr:TRAP transporter small permease subunit [Desulfohalobiaceae bacterium]
MPAKTIKTIDTIQDWFGFWTAMLILPMVLVVIYEVVMRYVFNAPTSWGFEATTFLYGLHYMLGFGYALLYNSHVKVDVFVSLLSSKKQTVISLICHLVLFLPVFGLLSYGCITFAWDSIIGLERSWTSWAPPIYPFKSLMALGFIMLWLQGISSILKDIQTLRSKFNKQ